MHIANLALRSDEDLQKSIEEIQTIMPSSLYYRTAQEMIKELKEELAIRKKYKEKK